MKPDNKINGDSSYRSQSREPRFRVVFTGLLVVLGFTSQVFSDNDIELNDQTATLTNLQGQIYQDIQLERATDDGLIYTKTNDGTIGMIRYADLSTNDLAGLKIPEAMIEKAARRKAALDAEKLEYAEASRELALQEETNEMAQAAVNPSQTSTQPTTPPAPKPAHRKRK